MLRQVDEYDTYPGKQIEDALVHIKQLFTLNIEICMHIRELHMLIYEHFVYGKDF